MCPISHATWAWRRHPGSTTGLIPLLGNYHELLLAHLTQGTRIIRSDEAEGAEDYYVVRPPQGKGTRKKFELRSIFSSPPTRSLSFLRFPTFKYPPAHTQLFTKLPTLSSITLLLHSRKKKQCSAKPSFLSPSQPPRLPTSSCVVLNLLRNIKLTRFVVFKDHFSCGIYHFHWWSAGDHHLAG